VISEERRLAARSLLVLGCLFMVAGGCCGGCGILGLLAGKGGAGGALQTALGAIVLTGGALFLAVVLFVLRKLILGFNQVAAIIAAVISSLGLFFGFLSVCGSIVGLVLGKAEALVSLGFSALVVAAYGQLLMYLIKVIKEPVQE
jgi:hypothetical protein